MNRKSYIGFVVIPLVATASYLGCLWYWPDFAKQVLHSERGLVEMATALAFLVASCLGLRLLVRTRGRVPMWASVIYGLFAAAGMFVALEEVSYGQKLFHWDTPNWFARTNSKGETNLHNMFGNKPSNRMRQVATIGCPVVCLILPSIACMRRGRYQPSHWTFYALPRMELATLAVISMLLTALHRMRVHDTPDIWEHTAEVRELVWSVAAVGLAAILSSRLFKRAGETAIDRSDQNESVAPRSLKAA